MQRWNRVRVLIRVDCVFHTFVNVHDVFCTLFRQKLVCDANLNIYVRTLALQLFFLQGTEDVPGDG